MVVVCVFAVVVRRGGECQCKCTHSGSCHFVSREHAYASCVLIRLSVVVAMFVSGGKQQLTSTSFFFVLKFKKAFIQYFGR